MHNNKWMKRACMVMCRAGSSIAVSYTYTHRKRYPEITGSRASRHVGSKRALEFLCPIRAYANDHARTAFITPCLQSKQQILDLHIALHHIIIVRLQLRAR